MTHIKAPQEWYADGTVSVFLAGSIEMGKAVDWQTELVNKMSDTNIMFINPRRDDWDSSWEQKKDNAKFREQVEWELDSLECVDYIVMVFDPKTMSPISLLELGLHANDERLIVYCPEGFWRKGNVDIVCEWHKIEQVETLEQLELSLRKKVTK